MRQIPFLNIADTNCWIVYNMPLPAEQRHNYDLVDRVQQACVERKFFGMGWDVEIPGFTSNTRMTAENAEKYVEEYTSRVGSVSMQAVNSYKAIQKGDYVITRNKNGHFLAGKVSSDGAYYLYDNNDEIFSYFSWGCTVEKWVEFTSEKDVPSEIVGRFSQRFHSTIQRIGTYRLRLLAIAMYGDMDIPKLGISEYNFAQSMNYMELEDLVSIFIAKRHNGYYLLPSSCKVSQQNIEFYFASGAGRYITCQVKNQRDITVEHYIHETGFEKIYLFSGLWDKDKVSELRKQYKAYPHVYIISPNELFAVLRDEQVFKNPYYDYGNEGLGPEEICLDGYSRKEKPNGPDEYSIDADFICFVKKDGLFYSKEFGALVLSYHVLDDHDDERTYIERIIKDINR